MSISIHNSNFEPFSLNLRGRLVEYTRPQVMGIVNVTPDSFYSASRTPAADALERRIGLMIEQGVDMIDVGAYSSRPGAGEVSPDEEIARLRPAMSIIRQIAPGIPVSVDTFRARVAAEAVEVMGADIINDISSGDLDSEMLPAVSRLRVPYIMMHMRGTPATMPPLTDYEPEGVLAGVINELWDKVQRATYNGIADIIIDPGFGFAKTAFQNHQLLEELPLISRTLRRPLLVGLSRKSMIYRPLGITPEDALAGTLALNTVAILKGASIVRVHDVAEAVQMRDILSLNEATN